MNVGGWGYRVGGKRVGGKELVVGAGGNRFVFWGCVLVVGAGGWMN